MVVQSLDQLEKNVSASFGYVKKDLLMLNDALSDINDKIQHLSLNHAALLDKLQSLGNKPLSKKKLKKSSNETNTKEISFYDVKTKKRFKTDKYEIKIKSGRKFAVATSPEGSSMWKILGSANSKKGDKKSSPKRIVKETIEY
jgi:hypothetical protein